MREPRFADLWEEQKVRGPGSLPIFVRTRQYGYCRDPTNIYHCYAVISEADAAKHPNQEDPPLSVHGLRLKFNVVTEQQAGAVFS